MSQNELMESVRNFYSFLKSDKRTKVDALEESDPNFSSVTFWLHFYMESQKLARSATKLTLAYSLPPAPSPSDTITLMSELIESYSLLVSCYMTLPKDKGCHLVKAVSSYLNSVKSSLIRFLDLFINALEQSSGYPDLCSVGVLLEQCKQVSSLPSDNKQAVIAVIRCDHDFMIDTVDEITSEMKNQINLKRSNKQGVVLEGESQVWSETEMTIVSHSLRLAKLGRTATELSLKLLKTQQPAVNSSNSPTQSVGDAALSIGPLEHPNGGANLEPDQILLLDELGTHSDQLSPQLDDIFTLVYPPYQDDDSLPPMLDKFKTTLLNFLDCLDRLSNISPSQKELVQNIRTQSDKTCSQLRTLLVSNEILSIADLNLL